MKKNLLRRCLLGAPTGLMIFVGITLIMAHLGGRSELRIGYYLIRVYGSEVNAATALVLSAMVMGMIWSAASMIYETDWNLLVQTLVHGTCCVIPSLAIAWTMYWIPRSGDGIIQYAAIFALIYVIVWSVQFLSMKKRLRQINQHLKTLDREA